MASIYEDDPLHNPSPNKRIKVEETEITNEQMQAELQVNQLLKGIM